MNNQIDKMQLPESARRDALERFAGQLRDWSLSMPPVEPLVMDFGQGDFDRVGLIEYWIANEIESGYCGKYLFLFDGQQCPFHSHQQKHETFFIVKGKVRMVVNNQERIMSAGDVLVMPPDDIHSFCGVGNALVLELSTPCLVSDNTFQDPGIAEWLKESHRETDTTSRKRVRKAIHFEGPDHVPHFLPDGKENDLIWLWMATPEPIRDWYSYDESTDRMTDCWGTTFYRAAGGRLGRGEVFEPAIKDITCQAEYTMPDKNNSAYFANARKAIAQNNASDNPKYCLGVMPFSSLNEGTHNLMGMENMFLAYYESPDDLKAFIARLAEGQRESIRKLAGIGCDGVMGYDDWGLQDGLMVSLDTIEEFFMPHYRENWKLAHDLGMDVWLHSCGHIVEILPEFIDAGLNVIQMDQQENMGLENLSEQFGGKIAFWCPVDIQRTMIEGSLEDIENYAKRMVETLGAHKGGLVSMAYSAPDDIGHTPEKLATMSRAFREYGIYKKE